MSNKTNIFSDIKSDFASGLVVFLVALPLCLGIAMASGAPLFSGIISGVIGGVIVGFLSTSHISVSGPAAGLTAIVLTAITDLGAFDVFLTSVFIAGCIQVLLGFLKAGSISNFFPTNVIEGMLAGIGIIIILKQLPHAFGYDGDFEGDEAFVQGDGHNTVSSLLDILNHINLGAITITLISILILIVWERVDFLKKIKLIPGALVAVLVGIILNMLFPTMHQSLVLSQEHLVSLPVPKSFTEFQNIIVTPDFSRIFDIKVLTIGFTIAIVASIESLLCIEAADRMDIQKRYTNPNIELKAQGIGNIVSALLGGLPMTSVVVRSSANSNAGAKTKMSAIIHGILLLLSVLTIPMFLNKIPLATLAAILLLVGYKLAKPSIFKHFWHQGKYQFVPFIATLLAVVFTDLLKGVALGLIISVFYILKGNMRRAYHFSKESYKEGDVIIIQLAQEVSFLNKAAIKQTLGTIPANSSVVIDASNSEYIVHDVLDLIFEFNAVKAKNDNIKVTLKGFKESYNIENTEQIKNNVRVEQYYDVAKRKMVSREIDNE